MRRASVTLAALLASAALGACIGSDSPLPDGRTTDAPRDVALPDKQPPIPDGLAGDGSPSDAFGDGAFVFNVVCDDGKTVDLTTLPDCKALIDKLLAECCPDPNPSLNTTFKKMLCINDPEPLCKASSSGPGFQVTCDSIKMSAHC